MLEVGTKAPDFTLQDQNGNTISLSDFLGKKVVLYFYPRDIRLVAPVRLVPLRQIMTLFEKKTLLSLESARIV